MLLARPSKHQAYKVQIIQSYDTYGCELLESISFRRIAG